MATKAECKYYQECGFVEWRANGVNNQANPLPDNGDCGIKSDKCARMDEENPTPLNDYGPVNTPEMLVSFPEIDNDNGRPPKRIHGGGHK